MAMRRGTIARSRGPNTARGRRITGAERVFGADAAFRDPFRFRIGGGPATGRIEFFAAIELIAAVEIDAGCRHVHEAPHRARAVCGGQQSFRGEHVVAPENLTRSPRGGTRRAMHDHLAIARQLVEWILRQIAGIWRAV